MDRILLPWIGLRSRDHMELQSCMEKPQPRIIVNQMLQMLFPGKFFIVKILMHFNLYVCTGVESEIVTKFHLLPASAHLSELPVLYLP